MRQLSGDRLSWVERLVQLLLMLFTYKHPRWSIVRFAVKFVNDCLNCPGLWAREMYCWAFSLVVVVVVVVVTGVLALMLVAYLGVTCFLGPGSRGPR